MLPNDVPLGYTFIYVTSILCGFLLQLHPLISLFLELICLAPGQFNSKSYWDIVVYFIMWFECELTDLRLEELLRLVVSIPTSASMAYTFLDEWPRVRKYLRASRPMTMVGFMSGSLLDGSG